MDRDFTFTFTNKQRQKIAPDEQNRLCFRLLPSGNDAGVLMG
jgi:hypothetical protein